MATVGSGQGAALARFVFRDDVAPRAAREQAIRQHPEARRAEIATIQRDARFDRADPQRIPSTTITVRPGDTLESIAQDYGTTIGQLARLNPGIHNLDDLSAGQALKVPVNQQVVEVKAGDTLDSIARRYGVDADQLARANGIANPDSIQAGQRIAIVPERSVGLDRNSSVREYIADMRAIQRDWPNLTRSQRLERIEDALNERLAASGVPPVRVTAGADGNASGVYDFSTHSIGVDAALLRQGKISTEEIKGLANTFYHEGRHAEQWFDMARLRIAQGRDPANMDLPASVIAAARDAPRLDPRSDEGRFVAAMYRSVYGAGAEARNDVLTTLANEDYSVYEDYRRLPEEADAWRVGGKVDNLWPRS